VCSFNRRTPGGGFLKVREATIKTIDNSECDRREHEAIAIPDERINRRLIVIITLEGSA